MLLDELVDGRLDGLKIIGVEHAPGGVGGLEHFPGVLNVADPKANESRLQFSQREEVLDGKERQLRAEAGGL